MSDLRSQVNHDRLNFSSSLVLREVHIAKFNVTVNFEGRVLASRRNSSNLNTPATWTRRNVTADKATLDLLMKLAKVSLQPAKYAFWHNDTFTGDWVSHVLRARSKENVNATSNLEFLVDPLASLPDSSVLAAGLSGMFTQLAATMISVNVDEIFNKAASPINIEPQIHK